MSPPTSGPERVFLHIGSPKTGTTFLQTLMWENRDVIREQGLLYPGRGRWDHFLAQQHVRRVGTEPVKAAAGWDRLMSETEQWPRDVLLSHEFYCAATTEQALWTIAQLRPAEVHVVLTVRDYVRQMPGVWLEAVKMGSPRRLDEFIDNDLQSDDGDVWRWLTQDAPAILDRWGQHLPPEHVHVITLPQRGASPDVLVNRWCGLMGIRADSLNREVARGNGLLGASQAALLHRVRDELHQDMRDGASRHRWLRAYLAETVLVDQDGEPFGLHREQAERFVDLSHQAVKLIEQGGYDVIGDLDDLIPDLDAAPVAHPDDVSESEILDTAVLAVEFMLRDIRDLTTERDRLRRRLHAAHRAANDLPPSPVYSRAGRLSASLRPVAARARRAIKRLPIRRRHST